MEKITFDKCSCCLYPSDKKDAPAVFIPVYEGYGEDVFNELNKKSHAPLNLLVIADINWSYDMAPFCMNALNANTSPCLGGAEGFLRELTQNIIPAAETHFALTPQYRVLCGYSLAGLFSLYALYRTTLFSRVGSFSGSLWLSDFETFYKEHQMQAMPERIYLSLGDQEKKSSHPLLKTVENKTMDVLKYYRALGINCAFELNNGGHEHNVAWRSAKGIIALTSRHPRIFAVR